MGLVAGPVPICEVKCEVMGEVRQPFADEIVEEIPLAESPLERVYGQVRFPLNSRVAKLEAIADFQGALGGGYSKLEQEEEVGIALTPGGGAKPISQQSMVWRLRDAEGLWQLSLAPTFLSLDTARYTSRTDFFTRFATALTALEERLSPGECSRVGVRFVYRLADPGLSDDLPGMVRPEVLGLAAASDVRESGALSTSMLETLFDLDNDDQLRVRSVLLPCRTGIESLQLPPVEAPSWVLDMDMFRQGSLSFNGADLASLGERFAVRIYRFFRWAVTDELLKRCGGVL